LAIFISFSYQISIHSGKNNDQQATKTANGCHLQIELRFAGLLFTAGTCWSFSYLSFDVQAVITVPAADTCTGTYEKLQFL
jgi:hypothetical protein